MTPASKCYPQISVFVRRSRTSIRCSLVKRGYPSRVKGLVRSIIYQKPINISLDIAFRLLYIYLQVSNYTLMILERWVLYTDQCSFKTQVVSFNDRFHGFGKRNDKQQAPILPKPSRDKSNQRSVFLLFVNFRADGSLAAPRKL